MYAASRRYFACAALAALLVGCSSSGESTGASAQALRVPGVLVEVDWLRQHLDDARLVVVDARNPQEYQTGHIAGAVNIPLEALFVHEPETHKNLVPVGVVQKIFGEAGIDSHHAVVVYDGENFKRAASVFWALEVHGHPSAAVLNVTYGKWVEGGLPTSTATPTMPQRTFVANLRPERLATKLTVLRALEGNSTLILDARSPEEYRGEKSAAARKGHIPTAVSLDFRRNMVLDKAGSCSLLYSPELLDLYKSSLQNRSQVICYCNEGNRASVSYLALRVLGYDCSVYDGSWLEWGNDAKVPVEVPAPQ